MDLGPVVRAPTAPDRQMLPAKNWGDCVEHLAGDGHALVGQVDEELARHAETLVDLETVVDVGIVDQTFQPTVVRGFEVRAHHD